MYRIHPLLYEILPITTLSSEYTTFFILSSIRAKVASASTKGYLLKA